jgi:signal transduction histidine kinase
MLGRNPRTVAAACCLLLLAAIFTLETIRQAMAEQRPVAWWEVLVYAGLRWHVWIAAFPLIFWFGRRFPFDPPRVARSVAAHAAFALVLSVAIIWAQSAVRVWVGWAPEGTTVARSFRFLLGQRLLGSLLGYCLICGISQAILQYFRGREQAMRSLQLEAELARTQLEALKTQVHPHFLFNTLNHIAELIHIDAHAAERMVLQLGDLLRSTLDAPAALHVPLRQEIDFVGRYLAIQQFRFGDRLSVRMNIDPSTLDLQVPNLILQPLVENAIQHGIASKPGAGTVEVDSRLADDGLEITVRDDGAGLGGGTRRGSGLGLANVRKRMLEHYGPRHRFELRSQPGRGVEVYLLIPRAEAA